MINKIPKTKDVIHRNNIESSTLPEIGKFSVVEKQTQTKNKVHPRKLTWNLNITHLEKENHLQNLHFGVPCKFSWVSTQQDFNDKICFFPVKNSSWKENSAGKPSDTSSPPICLHPREHVACQFEKVSRYLRFFLYMQFGFLFVAAVDDVDDDDDDDVLPSGEPC